MTIAWASFTPISAFLGGCLIGLAALLLMVFQGRIMGVSGIIGGLFGTVSPAERGWRLAFLLGAVAGPINWQMITKAPIIWQVVASGPQFYIAAFLVGLGTWHLRPCPTFASVIDCGDGLYDKRGGDCCHRQLYLAAATDHDTFDNSFDHRRDFWYRPCHCWHVESH